MLQRLLGDIFSHPDGLTLLGIVGRTVVIYAVVIIGMRLLGARPLGKMSAYDFVLVVVVANSVQNALVGGDNSLVGGLVSAITLLVANYAFTWALDRFPGLQKGLVGQPVVLVTDGHADPDRLRAEGVDHDELMAALREHGVERLEEVRLAVLEVDGTISIVPREATVHRTRRRFRGQGAG